MKQIPPEPEVDDADAVRIVLKTPNGKRLERRFHKNQSSKVCLDFRNSSKMCVNVSFL